MHQKFPQPTLKWAVWPLIVLAALITYLAVTAEPLSGPADTGIQQTNSDGPVKLSGGETVTVGCY
jgi:hypothetical protein